MMSTNCSPRCIPTHPCLGVPIGPIQSSVPTGSTHIMLAEIKGCENYVEHQNLLNIGLWSPAYF
jgi:hypothetical protein